MAKSTAIQNVSIDNRIRIIRGQSVLLDSQLSELYDVSTFVLNQSVRRNIERFPLDFMFQLTPEESSSLTSQIAISKGRGGRRTLPYAFTEQGVAMLSSVLRSPRAVAVNIQIMRAFVAIRQLITTHKDLATRIDALEKKYDGQFHDVFNAIRHLLQSPKEPKKPPIGFHTEEAAREKVAKKRK